MIRTQGTDPVLPSRYIHSQYKCTSNTLLCKTVLSHKHTSLRSYIKAFHGN